MNCIRSRILHFGLLVCFGGALASRAGATEISGTLLGADGRRPDSARVDVEAPEWPRPLASVEPGGDGSFRFSLNRGEMTVLRFLGEGLRDVVVPLPPGIERLRLEVVLGAEPSGDAENRESEACVRVLEGPASVERFVELYSWMGRERRRVASLEELVDSGRSTWDEVLGGLVRDAEARTAMVAAEKDPAVRDFATVTALAAWEFKPRASALARIAVDEVGPASPYWGLFPQALLGAKVRTGATVDSIRRFVERIADESPDRRVRSQALLALLRFHSEGDPERYAATRRRLLRGLPETDAAEEVREAWPASLAVGRGRPFPAVRFPSLEKGRPDIDLRDHRGRWVLLDVWAVWCGPCVAEVPELTKVWQRYGNRLDVVSVSLDERREIVDGFRKNRARMPWPHGILVRGFEDPVARRLAIRAVPSLFLLAPDGTLRATTLDLRGKDMVGSVGRLLAGKGTRAETAPAKVRGHATVARP